MTNLTTEEQGNLYANIGSSSFTAHAFVKEGIKKGTIGRVTGLRGMGYDWTAHKPGKPYERKFDSGTEVQIEAGNKRPFWYKAQWCDFDFNYQGETIYVNDKKNVPITNDMFGNPIELDSVVAYADKNIMCVGVVKRITDKGGVHVKLIKKGMEHWRERRLSEEEKETMLHRIPDARVGTYVIKPDALKELMYHKLVGV